MAVRYALGRWAALLRFCDDGRIEIDNNAAERALRLKEFLWSARTSARELVELMLAGDEDALMIATVAGTWMGRGAAPLIDSLNPEVVVLGSLAVLLGERVLEALAQAAAVCEIAPSVLGLEIGDVAALMAALNDPVVKKSWESNRA